ncbi:MAG: ubiquinol-cytochrome c reductase iron-sulfur subunit [Mycobacteriales bacterium]|nr:MAG: hypothetical protein DLM56_01785 [Pseudonocardiales bacterium]
MDTEISRRGALAVGAAGAGAIVVAGCGASSKPAGGPTGSAGPPSTAGSGSGTRLASLSAIPVGEGIVVKDGDSAVVVAQPTRGAAAAFSAKCTHMGCTVKAAGKELHCPCHGSKYSATTGAVLHGPAPRPLPKIAVHVDGGSVVAGA